MSNMAALVDEETHDHISYPLQVDYCGGMYIIYVILLL